MRKWLLIFLLLPAIAFADSSYYKGGTTVSGACSPACGSTLLGGQVDDESSNANVGSSGRWMAYKLLASTVDAGNASCVKMFVVSDADDTDENVGVAIYSHDSGNDRPDTLLTSGAFASHNWTVTGDAAIHSFVMDDCTSTADATDYWVAVYCDVAVTVESVEADTYEKRYTGTGQSYDSPPAGSAFSSSVTDKRVGIAIYSAE